MPIHNCTYMLEEREAHHHLFLEVVVAGMEVEQEALVMEVQLTLEEAMVEEELQI